MENIFFQISLGRIGNIMFHLAAAREYSKKTGRKPYIVYHETFQDYYKSLKYGPFKAFDIITDEEILEKANGKQIKRFFNSGADDYNPMPQCGDDTIPLFCGWRFDPRYFSRETALELYRPGKEIIDYIEKTLYPSIDFSECISINIRRGDFLIFKDPYVVSSSLFYETVMSKFPRDQKYVVTSDDIPWCKKHFKGDNFYFIDKPTGSEVFTKMYVDLYVATLCKHNIISNSTFSWWGAFLNETPNRKVFFQSPWLSDGNGMSIIPRDGNWIGIRKDVYIMNDSSEGFDVLSSIMCGLEYAKKNGMQAHLVNPNDFTFKNELRKVIDIVDKIDVSKIGSYVTSNETLKNVYTPLPEAKFLTDKDSVLINGLRMSPLYFDRDFTIQKLQPIDCLQDYAKKAYSDILGDFSEWVSLSVDEFDLDFIERAVRMFKNEKIFVVSRDIERAKSLLGDRFAYLDRKRLIAHSLIEFYAQKLAKSCIISSSSRDWWAAYLNTTPGRRVIYRGPFINNQSKQFNREDDMIPQQNNWIRL